MPFVRCKFYTESGEPLRGGCRRKGAGCAFVHPGDSNWISAPPPSFKAKDKSGDSGGFKPWGEWNKRAATASSAWDTGGNTGTSATDTGGGWGTGGGWDTGGSTSTSNQAPGPAQPKNSSTAQSWDTPVPANDRKQADPTPTASGNTKSSEDGWGGGADNATGSGWGSTGDGGWGGSSWGDTGNADKVAGSGWGSAQNDGWGASWGDKDADRDTGTAWGSARNDGWGAGWGDNKNTTNSWGVSGPMITHNQAEKEAERNKKKGKTVPAPPRIRIPNNESKKTRITGTNNEPLGPGKWAESRSSNLVTASTPLTTSTPVTTLTPTDSIRVKRKRDVAFDDKLDVFKEYVKTWERGVRARFLLAEAEAKRGRWFRTQKSACYTRVGEAGRKRLDGQRAECDKEVSSQREKLSGAITSLVELHNTISSNLDLGQRYNVGEEAERFIVESKAFVDEVRALLVAHVLKDKNYMQPVDTQKHPSGTGATFIDFLRSQIRDLEERFDHAQTELTLRHQRDIRSEIDELLTAKIARLRVARQHEIDRITSQPRPEIVIPPGALKNIEGTAQRVRELDARVPRAVEDIRVLLLRVDATTKRVSELEENLSMSKETYRKQMREMAAEKEETERRVEERLEQIREQMQQLVASQPPGTAAQLATTYNSRDKLVEDLRPALEATLHKFYEREVRPAIESLQQVVTQASTCHQEEAIRVLWGKMQPAMNMVAGVSRWLDSQELRLTAPVEEDQMLGDS